ncbi:MAG: dipicolinate synthase subunit DpsA [Oscillospiraceae bacterium]
MDDRFLFIGGDKRIIYAQQIIAQRFVCDRMGQGGVYPEPIGKYGRVVLPMPVSRDGSSITAPFSEKPVPLSVLEDYAEQGAEIFAAGTCAELSRLCALHGWRLTDYSADEPLMLKNAALTAEAAAALLIQSTEGSLFGARALVTGFGRCGRAMARLLKAFGAEPVVCARSAEQRALARLDGISAVLPAKLADICGKVDYIINTVPARLFSEEHFAAMSRGAVFMELATLPSEPTESRCNALGIKYIHAAGLPGKFSPKTAGRLIAEAILARLGD